MGPFNFVILTVLSTVASQVLFKFGVKVSESSGVSLFSVSSIFNLYIIGGLLFSVLSIISWIFALSKLQLSEAYPYMSLTFPLILICSIYFFNEPVSYIRWLGILFIMAGLFLIGRFA